MTDTLAELLHECNSVPDPLVERLIDYLMETDRWTEPTVRRLMCEYPRTDWPREVFARWLEGNVEFIRCPQCNVAPGVRRYATRDGDWIEDECNECYGIGRVSDGRAEFIRVQCELAAAPECAVPVGQQNPCRRFRRDELPQPWCAACRWEEVRGDELRRRERELLLAVSVGTDANWVRWNTTPFRGGCILANTVSHNDHPQVPRIEYRRGLIESVTLPTAAFLAHAGEIFGGNPVTTVTLSDRHPAVNQAGWARWWLVSDDRSIGTRSFSQRWTLPEELFDRLPHGPATTIRQTFIDYPSPDLALSALSAAAVAFGRTRAGLPPLDPPQSGTAGGSHPAA